MSRSKNRVGGRAVVGRGCRVDALERRMLFSITFDDPRSFNTGKAPTGVAAADLGTGQTSVAVVNTDDNTVGVLLGNGDGTLRAQHTYAVGAQPSAVALADLGNGHVDIVVTNAGDDTVSVLLGNGDGTFGAQQTYSVGSGPGCVAIADLGNGHPDLVVGNAGDNTVTVLIGNGNGTFGTRRTLSVGSQPTSVSVADLGNGHPDIVVANTGDNTVGVLLGNGTGTFSGQVTYNVGSNPLGVAVGDLGNGHPDIVVANKGDNTVGVLLGNGSGTFGSQTTFSAPGGPTRVAIADMGNGLPDVVVALSATSTDTSISLSGIKVLIGQVGILQGHGDGTLGGQATYPVPGVPGGLAVANVDAYNRPDVIISNSIDLSDLSLKSTLSILRNTTSASATVTTHLVFSDKPVDTIASTTLAPITVNVAAAGGNKTLTTDGSDVTMSIASGPAGATLGGATTVQASNGLATFTGLKLSTPGTYTLVATGNGITPVTSGTFTVLDAPPTGAAQTVGTLDATFGSNGLVRHNVGFTATTGLAAYGAQSVLIGPVGSAKSEKFGITRYNADGSLDTTFGNHGVTSTSFAGTDAVPTAVAVLDSGQILVAGTATTYASGVATGSAFAVARYNGDGSLDTTFGTNGTVTFGFSTGGALTNDVLRSMVLGPNGRIYLAGRSDAAGKGNTDFAIAALTAAGGLDTTFGSTGRTLIDVAGGDDTLAALTVQSNGAVVVAGSAAVGGVTEVALARVLSSGIQDLHFGTKGVAAAPVGGIYDAATSLTIGLKGVLIVGGVTATGSAAAPSSDFLVQRYTANGKLDKSFGKAGSAITSFGQPSAVTQVIALSDGSVIASGRTGAALSGTLDVAVARYTIRGVLNTGFNGVGKVVISLTSGIVASPAAELASALGTAFDSFVASQQGVVAVTPGGQVLVAGNSGSDTVEAKLIAVGIDLVAAVLASSVVPAGVGGLKGTATVTITDSGTDRAATTFTLVLGFSSKADGTSSIAARSITQKATLNPGKAKTMRVSFTYPLGLASGGYYLTTTVTGGTTVAAELNGANNTAVNPSAVTITPAVINLAGSALAAASPFTVGGVGKVNITVTNNGNVTAKGRIAIALYLSTDSDPAAGTPLATSPVSIGIPAGKPHTFKLSATVPTSLAAGTYTLLAIVDPGSALGTPDQTDVSAVVVGAVPIIVT